MGSEIQTMKAAGALDPTRIGSGSLNKCALEDVGPPLSQRTACTTTDFAMQNVILQMNLELLSVDGIMIRKLKSWVSRCQACFQVYTGGKNNSERLFCSRCGSSVLSRVAATVDSKKGSIELHLSRNYRNMFRGTKYKLPKPGNGDKFQT